MRHYAFFSLVIAASVGCSANVDGTGLGRDPSGGSSGSSSGGTGAETPPASTPSGAPAEIEALFAPPASATATPDTIFGVWAQTNGGSTEQRLKIGPDSLTLATKCSDDPRIAYVTVGVRATESKITILESKTARITYTASSTCSASIQLGVGESTICTSTNYYNCFEVSGTKLTGLSNVGSGDWIKLGD